MKTALLILAIAIAVAMAIADEDTSVYNGNGQPKKCPKSDNSFYRNPWDPTRYWVCKNSGEAAVEVECPGEYPAFHPKTLSCGQWSDWEWIAPNEPRF